MSSATYKVTSGREEMDLESPICLSSVEYDAVDKEKRRKRMVSWWLFRSFGDLSGGTNL